MPEANNDSFKEEMIAEMKRIQIELNELKNIKKNIEKKSAKKIAAKKKEVKRKPAKKTIKRKTTRSK